MWHVPGMWGSQSYWSLEKERTMSSLIICYSARALFGITQHCSEEGLPGDRRDKGRLQIHILLLGFFTDQEVDILPMCVERRMGLSFGPRPVPW